ncbi:transcription elongation factor GreB, partial [Klebsiella pneumoniae]|nr:transcription elongation factor GreB [Klebsiella pneumoniae]
ISVDSPVARALIGKQADDEVTVITPNGEVNYVILSIRYQPIAE